MNDNVKAGFDLHGAIKSQVGEKKSLGGLNALNILAHSTGRVFGRKHIYGGTVTAKVKHHRRSRNAVAKQSRKVNRGS